MIRFSESQVRASIKEDYAKKLAMRTQEANDAYDAVIAWVKVNQRKLSNQVPMKGVEYHYKALDISDKNLKDLTILVHGSLEPSLKRIFGLSRMAIIFTTPRQMPHAEAAYYGWAKRGYSIWGLKGKTGEEGCIFVPSLHVSMDHNTQQLSYWLTFGMRREAFVHEYFHHLLKIRLKGAREKQDQYMTQVKRLKKQGRWNPTELQAKEHELYLIKYKHVWGLIKSGKFQPHHVEIWPDPPSLESEWEHLPQTDVYFASYFTDEEEQEAFFSAFQTNMTHFLDNPTLYMNVWKRYALNPDDRTEDSFSRLRYDLLNNGRDFMKFALDSKNEFLDARFIHHVKNDKKLLKKLQKKIYLVYKRLLEKYSGQLEPGTIYENKLRQVIREEIKRINEATLANDAYYRNLTKVAYDDFHKLVKSGMAGDFFMKKPWKSVQIPAPKGKGKSPMMYKGFGISGERTSWTNDQSKKIGYVLFTLQPGQEIPDKAKRSGGYWTEQKYVSRNDQGTIVIFIQKKKNSNILAQLERTKETFLHEYLHFLDYAGDTKDVRKFGKLPKGYEDGGDVYNTTPEEYNTHYQEFQDRLGEYFQEKMEGDDKTRATIWKILGYPLDPTKESTSELDKQSYEKFANKFWLFSRTPEKAKESFLKFVVNSFPRENPKVRHLSAWVTSTKKNSKYNKKFEKRLLNVWEYLVKNGNWPPLLVKGDSEIEFRLEFGVLGSDPALNGLIAHRAHPHELVPKSKIKWPPAGVKNIKHDTRGK